MTKHLYPFILIIGLVLSSCEDAKLAKAVDGKWETNITMKDEYGTPYTQRQIYDFRYEDSGDKDGGRVTEHTITSMTEEVDDTEVSYTATSTIKGEWEVIFGDLYFTYNLSTLDVAITNVDYQISENADLSTRMDYAEAVIGMALLGQELIDKDELAEEIRKNAYQSFYESYELDNNDEEGSYYEDLKVAENTMSFHTADMGQMELKRVKTSPKRNATAWKTQSRKKQSADTTQQATDTNVISSGTEEEEQLKRSLAMLLEQWDAAHNDKSYATFNAIYADNVLFYGQALDMEHCIANKQKLLEETYHAFVQHSENAFYEEREDGSIVLSFDKHVQYDGKSQVFPSYLIIRQASNGAWKIIVESDKIADKNLQANK